MSCTSPVPSIASVSSSIGARVAKHADLTFRAIVSGPGVDHTERFLRYLTGEPHPLGNIAIFRAVADPECVKAATAPFLGAIPSVLLFPEGVGAGIADAATGMGYQSAGSMPAMAVDLESLAATSLPPGYALKRVGLAENEEWTAAFAAGYELPAKVARLFSPEVAKADPAPDAKVQFFAVTRDGRMVATSVLCVGDGLAGVYCVATLPEERKRGLGAHATAEALRAALLLGYRVGILQSSPEGHGVYLKLGFKDVGGVPMFVRMPG